MTTTFETAKVGDRVWSVEFGWGEVKFLDFCETYPIRVMHSDDKWESYMLEGKRLMSQTCQTLFWDEVVIEAPVKTAVNLTSDAKQVSELRDRLAIAYMQSCVAGNAYFETFEGVSEEAYKMADVMLEARSK